MSLLVMKSVLLLASVSCWYLSCCWHPFCFLVFSLLPACFCFNSLCFCHSCWCWRPCWSWCSFFPVGILTQNEAIDYRFILSKYQIQKTIRLSSYGLRPQSVEWSQKTIACSMVFCWLTQWQINWQGLIWRRRGKSGIGHGEIREGGCEGIILCSSLI